MHLLAFAVLAQEAAKKPETTNPILPATNELIWGAISFTILFVVLAKLAWPALKKGLDERAAVVEAEYAYPVEPFLLQDPRLRQELQVDHGGAVR